MKHLKITVKGRVQGVWFRARTKEKAVQFNIKGFVKNKLNGDVYIEAEGESISISEFLKWCKKGPQLAYVEEILTETGEVKNFSDFRIVR